jgi:hypothetical protein
MQLKTALSLCVVLALYLAGYVYVRYAFCQTGLVTSSNPNGSEYLPPVAYVETNIWIPSDGSERWMRNTVYWVFYPNGHIDESFTGRRYHATDERNVWY